MDNGTLYYVGDRGGRMGMLLLILATTLWSLVGILVKQAATMVDTQTITFARFFIGILFLGIFLFIKDKKIDLHFRSRFIWYGAIGKSCNYLFENIALHMGYSYGNILVGPIQSVLLIILSAVYFKEKITKVGWIASTLCLSGVLIISTNGSSPSQFFESGGLTTLLFVLAGIGAAFHVWSQKVLIQTMDSGNLNFSTFFWASVITAVPVPFQFSMEGPVHAWGILSLLILGFITGVSFYIFALALKRVSMIVAVIVSNMSVIFSLLWSKLVFNEPITIYIILGTIVFLAGVILINIPVRKDHGYGNGARKSVSGL